MAGHANSRRYGFSPVFVLLTIVMIGQAAFTANAHAASTDGGHDRGELAPILDRNGDGEVTDREAMLAVRILQRKQGLTRTETESQVAQARQEIGKLSTRIADVFVKLDLDGDDGLDESEFDRAVKIAERSDRVAEARCEQLFSMLDRDRDQRVSQVEAVMRCEKLAAFLDAKGKKPRQRTKVKATTPASPLDRIVRSVFAQYDRDRDHRISHSEAMASQGQLVVRFFSIDANEDEHVSPRELHDYLASRQKAQTPASGPGDRTASRPNSAATLASQLN